jgi:adenosine kinase
MEAAASAHTTGGIDVLFFCNPLLDISVEDHDAAIL